MEENLEDNVKSSISREDAIKKIDQIRNALNNASKNNTVAKPPRLHIDKYGLLKIIRQVSRDHADLYPHFPKLEKKFYRALRNVRKAARRRELIKENGSLYKLLERLEKKHGENINSSRYKK